MENIDRVNRFFWLRVPFFPLILLIYLIKQLTLKTAAKNYVSGVKESSELDRYSRFFAFHNKYLFFSNLLIHFFFKEKIRDQQTIFIVSENLDWNSVPLLAYICRNQKHLYPRLLLNNIFIDKNTNNKNASYWDLIDSFYGEKDLDRAISSKRSFLIEKSFIDRHPKVIDKLKESYIPISPVYMFSETKSKLWFVSGKLVKTSSFASFKSSALLEAINNSFNGAKKEVESIIEKSKESKISGIKSIFTIK